MNQPRDKHLDLLRMEHIGKSFSGVPVLEDVHFDLQPGEVHVLAGENGAGKTTLIKILSGAHSDYEGDIFLEGKRVRFKSPQDARLKGISAIHQDLALVDSIRVVDNLFLGRERTRGRWWMDWRSQKAQARQILQPLGISVDLEEPLSSYPLSVRQMIEIAKALASDARILIMDEPTSALSEAEAGRLFDLINQLKQRKCSVIYITHRLEEIFRIADRVSVLRDGWLVGTARSRDLTSEELIRWMVGREIQQQFPERRPEFGPERLRVEGFSLPDPSGKKGYLVEEISLRLRAGEILGLAGLRGSGKSEFLNGLFGTYGRDVFGEVVLDNRRFEIISPRHSIEQGLVLQTNDRKRTGLVSGLSVAWNITLPSLENFSPRGWVKKKEESAAAQKQIQELGIKVSSPAQEVATLSGGNQQKVVLAKWLQTKPKVLLLDEPTLGVDVGAKHEIYHLMNALTRQGMAILLVTSELPELLAMSDRLLVLHRGRVQAELDREEATDEKVIRAAMGESIH